VTKNKILAVVILAAMGMLSTSIFARDFSNDRFQVTDPEVLESMGFPSDADNVFQQDGDKNVLRRNVDNFESDTDEEVPSFSFAQVGTRGYSGISAKEFVGRIDSTGSQWAWAGGPNCCVDLSRAGSERFADAQLHLPEGASLDGIRWWIYDANSSADASVFVFENCQPAFASGPITINTIASASSAGSNGHQSGFVSISPAVTVDNRNCTYLVRVRFDAASTNLALQKVRAQYIYN
jgi:hypothetical protein